MNCHIVPQVYLRSWKIPEFRNSIYLFDKGDIIRNGIQTNIELKNTDFAVEDKYLLKTDDHDYIYELLPEFALLYDSLMNYKLSYQNVIISTVDEFINNYKYILNWDIIDPNNKVIDPIQIKASLEALWEEKVERLIENYFDRNIENYWKEFLIFVENKIMKRGWMVYAEYKEYFLEFVAIQLSRRTENLKKLGIDFLVEFSIKQMEKYLSKDFLNETINSDGFKEDLCLIQLYKYVKYKISADNNYENNTITKIIDVLNEQIQICFFISPPNVDFITSDNPCIHIPLKSQYNKWFSGIYLPVNKHVCAFLCKNKGGKTLNKYLIMDLSAQNTKYINNIILQNCISKVAYEKNSIINLIEKMPNNSVWKEMFSSVGLEFINCSKEGIK